MLRYGTCSSRCRCETATATSDRSEPTEDIEYISGLLTFPVGDTIVDYLNVTVNVHGRQYNRQMKASTIKDVAQAANVSTNTVSRALNNKPDVSKETRAKVLSIAKELNYSPNNLARSLISKHTGTLGVVVTDNANPFYARVIKGIEDVVRTQGYNIILCNTDEDSEREVEAIRLLQQKRVDGILITPVQHDSRYLEELNSYPNPYVLLNRHPRKGLVDYVINDNAYGARLAVHRLTSTGRKNIAYICGPSTISSVQERLQGCKDAMEEAGLSSASLRVERTNLKMEGGVEAMERLLAHDPPDGVFAYSDILAIGAMKSILEARLRIPDDIALIGYDDIEFAGMLEVPLTTVRQPRYRIGEEAARILLKKLDGSIEEEVKSVVLRPELIVRKSG